MNSKTEQPCDCDPLQRCVDDPAIPIGFDEKMGEYFVARVSSAEKGLMLLRHCPFCGGKLPVSRRAQLFHVVTGEERTRLRDWLAPLKTRDAVVAALGPPDSSSDNGSGHIQPGHASQPYAEETFETYRYTALSETVDVAFAFHPDGQLAKRIMFPKLLSQK